MNQTIQLQDESYHYKHLKQKMYIKKIVIVYDYIYIYIYIYE